MSAQQLLLHPAIECPPGNCQVALWTHKALIITAGEFAHVYELPNPCYCNVGSDATEVPPNPNDPPYCITTVGVDEFSLVAYCVIIRYLISGRLGAARGPKWLSLHRSGVVGELMVDPIKTASWEELNMLTERYGLQEFKTLCAEHLPTTNTTNNPPVGP
ncbi:hypothetical protein BGZ81_002479 [Podila clonocystis]|nr:hypothetical protein BGZ81_002479 [Podila clonocystis]